MPGVVAALPWLLVLGSLAAGASAEVCTATAANNPTPVTWHGPAADGGSVAWSGCAPSVDDAFLVPAGVAVTIDANLGSSASPIEGDVVVGGRLDVASHVHVHNRGDLVFEAGSDGAWQGSVLDAAAAPSGVEFPTPTTVRLDFEGAPPPWPLCDPTGVGLRCDATTVHPVDADLGEETPATFLYVEWEKLGAAPQLVIPTDGHVDASPVYDPGQWLEVVGVEPGAVTAVLPSLGPNFGHHYFGASNETTPDGEGRCEECIDGSGAPGATDHPGGRFRNAVAEPQWALDPESPFRLSENGDGQARWELLLDPAAVDVNGNPVFTHAREFDGFLACRPSDQVTLDPGSEDWCARIVRTDVVPQPLLVVWKSPEDVLQPGDRLNVYYSRPSTGDTLVPVNAIAYHGVRSGQIFVEQGSHFGQTQEIRALWFSALGPDAGDASAPGLTLQNFADGFSMDLVLLEHQGGDVYDLAGVMGIRASSEGNTGTVFSDARISRYTYRSPDARCFHFDASDDGRRCSSGIKNHQSLGQSWTDVGFRKLRLDLVSAAAVGNSKLWRVEQCKDGLFLQDLFVFGARPVRDGRLPTQQQELLETRGERSGCDFDRIAIVGEHLGTPIIMRCDGCPPGTRKWLTSVVVFGQADFTASPTIHSGRSIGADFDAGDFFTLANFVTDGGIGPGAGAHYGARVGHFPTTWSARLPGLGRCLPSVGIFARGMRVLNDEKIDGCGATSAVTLLDLYLTHLTASTPLLGAGSARLTPPTLLRIENSIFHWSPGTTSQVLLVESSAGNPFRYLLDHLTLVPTVPLGTAQLNLVETTPGAFVEELQLGPNVYTTDPAGDALNAVSFSDTQQGIVADALAPSGDGLASTGWARGVEVSPTTFAVEGLGSGVLPEACATANCDFLEAAPRWAGPVVYDWPFAWATVDPVPGFRRTVPRPEFLPSHLIARAPAACGDTHDNDADGAIDLADPGCAGPADPSEGSAVQCDDAFDNDDDGLVDLDDPNCSSPTDGREGPQRGCGLGAELGLVWLLLARGRRRRAA